MTNCEWGHIKNEQDISLSKLLVNFRPCPVCGATNERTILVLDNFQFYCDLSDSSKLIDIRQVQCQNCYTLYLNPCYSSYGFKVLFSQAGYSYGATATRYKKNYEWILEHNLIKDAKAIIDIGCFKGDFLSLFPEDILRIGIEVDENIVKAASIRHKNKQIIFYAIDFHNYNPPIPPDLITMFHVLEHLPSPVKSLKQLRRIAHKNTYLVVEVPIIELAISSDINGFFSVQHMTHFSKKSLKNCLNRSGWKIIIAEEQKDYNGFRVVAVPSESKTDFLGDPFDVIHLYHYLSNWYKSIEIVCKRIIELASLSRIVIWGAGLHTEFLYQLTPLFSSNPDRKYLIVDSDPDKQNKTWRGIPIKPPASLKQIDFTDTYLLISSYGSQEGIYQDALNLKVPEYRIIKLYEQIRNY